MKKYLLLPLPLFFCLIVSAQGNFPTADSVVNYLQGPWRLHRYSGGIAGTTSTSSSPGWVSASIVFTKIATAPDSISYAYYYGGSLKNTGHSKVKQSTGINPVWYFEFNKLPNSQFAHYLYLFDAKSDSLILSDYMISDGFMSGYVRDYTLGVSKNKKNSFLTVYPIPANNELIISGTENGTVIENLFDLTGKNLEPALKNQTTLDISALQPGVYLIRLRTLDSIQYLRFIKQ